MLEAKTLLPFCSDLTASSLLPFCPKTAKLLPYPHPMVAPVARRTSGGGPVGSVRGSVDSDLGVGIYVTLLSKNESLRYRCDFGPHGHARDLLGLGQEWLRAVTTNAIGLRCAADVIAPPPPGATPSAAAACRRRVVAPSAGRRAADRSSRPEARVLSVAEG